MLSHPVAVFAMFCAFLFSAGIQSPVTTLELGFEAGSIGEAPSDWFVPTEGWVAELSDGDAVEGELCAVLTKPGASTAPFGNLMRSIEARPYQGRRVELSAKIRVEGEGGRAQMWIRADRPNRRIGAHDNMGDRPIPAGDWTDAVIELEIDDDAERIALGFKSFGSATLFIESRPKLTALNRSTRLAGVALCWGVMQHFYPYFDVVETDWDAALDAALAKAAEDADELAYLGTLRELVAKLHDGHGGVQKRSLSPASVLPVALAWAGEDLVVVGMHDEVPAEVQIGDVVLSIDGKDTSTCYQQVSRGISAATEGWRRFVSLGALTSQMPTSNPVPLRLRHPTAPSPSCRSRASLAWPWRSRM